MQLSVEKLCNGDPQRPIVMEVVDYDSDDKYEQIGASDSNVNLLIQAKEMVVWNKEKEAKMLKKKKKYEGSGKLRIKSTVFKQTYSFIGTSL